MFGRQAKAARILELSDQGVTVEAIVVRSGVTSANVIATLRRNGRQPRYDNPPVDINARLRGKLNPTPDFQSPYWLLWKKGGRKPK